MTLLLGALLAATSVMLWPRRRRDQDVPARLVAAAVRRFPPHRSEWADAVVAELAAVRGQGRRWAFAAGAVRLALLPPGRDPRRVRRTALCGALLTALTTLVGVTALPTLAAFLTVLSILLSALGLARAIRRPPEPTSVNPRAITAVAITGTAAAVAAMIAVTVRHPAATADHTHVLSTLFAAALVLYLIVACAQPPAPKRTVTRAALIGAVMLIAVTVITTVPRVGATTGVRPLLSLPAIAVCVTVSVVVGYGTSSRVAARRAGVLAVVLATPVQFAISALALLGTGNAMIASSYDRAAYTTSGYPDVVSYLISDALAGHIISGVILGPMILSAAAFAGAAASVYAQRRVRRPPGNAG